MRILGYESMCEKKKAVANHWQRLTCVDVIVRVVCLFAVTCFQMKAKSINNFRQWQTVCCQLFYPFYSTFWLSFLACVSKITGLWLNECRNDVLWWLLLNINLQQWNVWLVVTVFAHITSWTWGWCWWFQFACCVQVLRRWRCAGAQPRNMEHCYPGKRQTACGRKHWQRGTVFCSMFYPLHVSLLVFYVELSNVPSMTWFFFQCTVKLLNITSLSVTLWLMSQKFLYPANAHMPVVRSSPAGSTTLIRK
jgi:hypothetical protein